MKLQPLLVLCAHGICASRDTVDTVYIIEYRDNFLDNNREMIFLISPNPTVRLTADNFTLNAGR
jgi:hypothetical protein